jgi:cytoskeleton protein RodZ
MADSLGDANPTNTQAVSLGEQLRRSREAKKITVEKAASSLRVKTDIINHLENENWPALFGRTYARGYLINYVKYLGLPQNDLVEMFNLHYQVIGTERNEVRLEPDNNMKDRALYNWAIAFFVILMGVAIYLFVYTDDKALSSSVETQLGQRGE